MHLPNGFLDPKTSAGAAFAAAAVLGYCIARVRSVLSIAVPEALMAGIGNVTHRSGKILSSIHESHFMKMGAVASLIFSAQMFNFPIDGGTSGHLLGGVLAAIVLGPFSGTIAIAVVLAVQSIFFGDGGMMALGANILNMAVVGTFLCYYIFYILKNRFGFNVSIGIAAFFSVLLSALFCAIEIGISGAADINSILAAMASIHARIGLAEALLTILAVNFLSSMNFGLDGDLE